MPTEKRTGSRWMVERPGINERRGPPMSRKTRLAAEVESTEAFAPAYRLAHADDADDGCDGGPDDFRVFRRMPRALAG